MSISGRMLGGIDCASIGRRGSHGVHAQAINIGIQATLALPFFGLRPRMPPRFKRDIQREGMRRMDRKRIAVAV
jgi:hypothetical protein